MERNKHLDWLNRKYPGYNFKNDMDWYMFKLHTLKGATYRPEDVAKDYKNNLRAKSHTGGSTDMDKPLYNELSNVRRKYVHFVPMPMDMESIFDFNYTDMLNCEPNKKFNKVKSLIFNHEYYHIAQQKQFIQFIDIYNSLSDNDLNKINLIYQKLSTYIKENDLSHRYVDGSVLPNIALMISKYLKTGVLDTDMKFFNYMEESTYKDIYNQFHLFLIRNCFIGKNRYYYKHIGGIPVKNWWSVCKLLHRISNKDMKTKFLCEPIRDENGKIIYVPY